MQLDEDPNVVVRVQKVCPFEEPSKALYILFDGVHIAQAVTSVRDLFPDQKQPQ